MKGQCVIACGVAIATLSASVLAQPVEELRIPDGTRVSVRLLQSISSETSKQGDSVSFEVIEDVSVNGHVVIKQGAPARGAILEAAPKGRMGRAGKLVFAITETKGIDGSTIRLRSANAKSGESHVTGVVVTTAIVAWLVPPVAPIMLLRHGSDVGSAEGSRFDAFVEGDHRQMPPRSGPSAGIDRAGAALSNSDLIAMHRAGVADTLIVAKIETSAPAYSVTTEGLIQLKKAGLSDPVVAAVVAAAARK